MHRDALGWRGNHEEKADCAEQSLSRFECSYPVRLVNGCAHQFLGSYNWVGTEPVNSDPPSLAHTRTSQRKYRFGYKERDHIELLELLKTLPCPFILSGYASYRYTVGSFWVTL